MYKKLKEYDFREIVGHFVLMKNTSIVNNPKKYAYMDERYEDAKLQIIQDTKDYYKETNGYEEELDYEDIFSLDELNKDMTTRKIADLYEPLFGYIGIEKTRGLVLYLLGNKEDKYKYIYTTAYASFKDDDIENIEIEIIDDDEYEHADFFKEHIEAEEEQDERVLMTRNIKNLDKYRIRYSPDFVNCIVSYKNKTYVAKVKLSGIEENTIYAKYHEQEGILNVIQNENTTFLVFKSTEQIDEEECFTEFINEIIKIFTDDYDTLKEDVLDLMKYYQEMIEKSYIEGDTSFETALTIYNELLQDNENTDKE